MKTPHAIINSEQNGVFTFGCKTKEQAVELMQEAIDDWQCLDVGEEEEQIVVDIDRIQAQTMYLHRKCGWYNFEQTCEECGEHCGTVGRETFYFNFD